MVRYGGGASLAAVIGIITFIFLSSLSSSASGDEQEEEEGAGIPMRVRG